MHETEVAFFSEGVELKGLLRSPAGVTDPVPAIVQGPGWLGLKDDRDKPGCTTMNLRLF